MLLNVASDQGLHSLHLVKDFLKHMVIIKNYPDTPFVGNGPVQNVDIGVSTWHKWVNTISNLNLEQTCLSKIENFL